MFKKLIVSAGIAARNIRRNLFHTLLSIIGVVIGVAALVSMLSLIDGMERSIREGITQFVSLQTITVRSEVTENVHGVRVRKEKVPVLTVHQINEMMEDIGGFESAEMKLSFNTRLYLLNHSDTLAGHVYGKWTTEPDTTAKEVIAGRLLRSKETGSNRNVAVINKIAAELTGLKPKVLLDKALKIRNQQFDIVGVVKDSTAEGINVCIPVLAMNNAHPDFVPPELQLNAEKFEYVDTKKEKISEWLDGAYKAGSKAFDIQSTQMLLEEASRGILIFKIFMGAIIGIAVIVGGVGIMNVLIISVRERTKEIGIRKATGARKKDIGLQFLSESITISLLGSFLGLVLGLIGTYGIVAIIGTFVDIGSYHPVFTWSTLIIVMAVAIMLGVIFGTYPAIKASRLTPVDAIRRE